MEATRLEKAKNCNHCFDWTNICEAECCKGFSFKKEYVEGLTITNRGVFAHVRLNLTPDLKRYYLLHGAVHRNNRLSIKAKSYFERDGEIHFVRRCDYLTDDLKCRGHDKKPRVCRELTEETYNTGLFGGTPNCLFKYKQLLKKGLEE